MWSNPGQDPGGPAGVGPPQNPSSSQELDDLKDQYEHQQLLISQLKELLRKTEQTNVSQEKVEKYANTLTKMNERAKKTLLKKEGSHEVLDTGSKQIETPASEKINMLRQQLEQNKIKLAERGKNQKGLEEMVIQIKAQLDDSQNLINQTPLNLSLIETKIDSYSVNSSSQELYNILLNKEKKISDMAARIQKLEANVLDLQENLKEKDSVIDARTKAITLLSDNLSKKGRSTLEALDETKLQMRTMQENFVELELRMKTENERLMQELNLKNSQVTSLQQANEFLQSTRQEFLQTISELQDKSSENAERFKDENEALVLNNRIKELENINSSLQVRLNSIASIDETDFTSKVSDLEKSNSELSYKIDGLEKSIAEKNAEIITLQDRIKDLSIVEGSSKKVDFDVKQENAEVARLKKQLDESNKNMIKVKAQHKSKIKDLNKKIEDFKKVSDTNAEILRLQDENSKLNQKIVELEEEKGSLQLKVMESDSTKDSISVEHVHELESSISEQSEALIAKEETIKSLEKQIEDYASRVETLNEKLDSISQIQNVQVKSEITSIHLEEQLDKLESEKQELLKEKLAVIKENEELLEKIEALKKEKQEISLKLESYIQENIDLMDKLDKLSAEKVSSAESIEIVEGLTQQEKLELEAYQKNINISTGVKTSNEHLEENPELSESVHQLTEETTELLQRIELFTVERREVMEKMENLTQENNSLALKLKETENNRDVLAETYEQLQNEKEQLDENLDKLEKQKSELQEKLIELGNENKKLRQDINESEEIRKNEIFQGEIISDLHSTTQFENDTLLKEIEEYKTLTAIQKQEINELRVKLMQVDVVTAEKLTLEEKLTSLQTEYEKLLTENEDFKREVKKDLVHEKDNLEKELQIAKKQIFEFEERLSSNLNEIESYKATLEENKSELLTSAKLITDLQSNVQEKEEELSNCKSEIGHLNSTIGDLNAAIAQLEENNANIKNDRSIETMSEQLQELKIALNENIQQIQQYEEELQINSEVINELQKEIKTLNNRILETNHFIEIKDDEIKQLQNEKNLKETEISTLQQEIVQLKENFNNAYDNLKKKCEKLISQIDANAGSIQDIKTPLEQKISELEGKNKEQMEKIKKYAAGLKKKTAAYQELEQKYSEINEKWEIEQKEKETLKIQANKNSALESKVQSLVEQLNDLEKELTKVRNELDNELQKFNKLNEEFVQFKQESLPKSEFSKLEIINAELQQHIFQYNLQKEDLQNILKEYESKYQMLTAENELLKSNTHNNLNAELTQKDETIVILSNDLENLRYTSETNSNAMQMKIQELEMFIETQDAELSQYKDKVNKLEETLSYVEERRLSLENKTIELGAELKEKSNDYDKVSQTEDLLEERLNALIAHDEIIESRLKDSLSENQNLVAQNKELLHEIGILKSKIHTVQEKVADLKASNECLSFHETENEQLKQVIMNLETEKRHLKSEYENKFNKSKTEAEKYEVELQNQVELFNKERKTLLEECEKLNDKIKEYIEANEVVQNELDEYKQKVDEQKNTISEQKSVCEKLDAENKSYVTIINDLNIQLREIENLKTEINHLNIRLEGKNNEIEEYRQQNLQLQQQRDSNNSNNKLQEAEVQKVSDFFSFDAKASNEIHLQQQQMKDLEMQKANDEANLKLNDLNQYLQQVLNELNVLKQSENEMKEMQEYYNKELAIWRDEKVQLETNNKNLLEEIATFRKKLPEVGNTQEKPFEAAIKIEADKKIGDSTQIQMFTWPELHVDPFDFVADNNSQVTVDDSEKEEISEGQNTTVVRNTNEELLQKIKTLEYMLYNTEKEKEEALLQCNELSTELTRLVYDRENHKNIQMNSNVETQIISDADTCITEDELKQLQNLEFEKTKTINPEDKVDYSKPVTEDKMETKSAYLCYTDMLIPDIVTHPPVVISTNSPNIDSQIVSPTDTEMSSSDRRQLHDLEFEKCKPVENLDEAKIPKPVTEDKIRKKSAYLCYDPELEDAAAPHTSITFDNFGENDDGWGWGPEEAKLEQEHQEMVESTSHNLQFKAQLNELEEKISVLEQARERHLEEIKQSQLKSGKLIKKLKEFKTKNEELSSQLNRKSDNFDDLNDAIQDELKLQIQNLEKRIKEVNLELEKEKIEKSNLLKRVDVLTAANERMVDSKEKQDVEILAWQRRSQELSAKLEQVEWGDGGFESPKHTKSNKPDESSGNVTVLQAQIKELNDQIQDLTLDNEELQALLEEQRNLRINAEKAKSVEPVAENMKTEAEYLMLLTEKNNLQATIEEEKLRLQEKIEFYMKSKEIFDKETLEMQEKIDHLIKNEEKLNKEKSELANIIIQSNEINHNLNEKLEILQNEYDQLNLRLSAIPQTNLLSDESEKQCADLRNQIEKLSLENKQVKDSAEAVQQENATLTAEVSDKNKNLDELKVAITELEANVSTLHKDINVLNSENQNLKYSFEEKSKEVIELKETLEKVTQESEKLKENFEEKLTELQRSLEDKTKQLLSFEEKTNQQHTEMEYKFSTTFQQLTEEWSQRVDQRGIDVAESWKLHLEARENEFMQIEQQLKKEIDELEEKYNGLVNENNELRKNVDTEIRNEVDRVSALQQQINDRQNYINELTRLLQEKQIVTDKQLEDITKLEEKVQSLKLQIEEHASVIDQRDSLQLQLTESQNIIDELNKQLKTKDMDSKKITSIEEEIEQYKGFVSDLQNQIANKEELLLQNSETLNNYNQELESHKKALASLTQNIKEKDVHIDNLTKKLQNYDAQKELDATNLSILQQQVYDYQKQLANVTEQLQQSYLQVESLNQELIKSTQLTDQLITKENEISALKLQMERREREIQEENLVALNEQAQELDSLKRLLAQNESRYEEMLSIKDIDSENLRLQLLEQVNRNEILLKEKEDELIHLRNLLSLKSSECEELQNKVQEQSILLGEENRQLFELREIIQEQVLKIDDLQKQLYNKSRDYDALIAEIDIPQKSRKDLQEKHVTFADETEKDAHVSSSATDDLSDPVSRAELDIALYMLHQRDVRCEELTVELMQLLEERDTLQLRLSNALREKEELKSRYKLKTEDEHVEGENIEKDNSKTIHKGKAAAIVLGATGTELAAEATEQLKNVSSDFLTSKLSELKTVGYRKDKTLVDEQELRRLQQFSIMQQHRDEAAKLPPEAAARLVDASYTLSRDVQSPSKVLLNWLWGRSTPKVNNV